MLTLRANATRLEERVMRSVKVALLALASVALGCVDAPRFRVALGQSALAFVDH